MWLLVFLSLGYLNIISMHIYFPADFLISYFFMAELNFIICIYHISIMYSSADEFLSCFHFWFLLFILKQCQLVALNSPCSPGWSWTCNPPASAPWVVGTTGLDSVLILIMNTSHSYRSRMWCKFIWEGILLCPGWYVTPGLKQAQPQPPK